ALSSSTVPWKPTSSSSPSRGLRAPNRSGPGAALRQPATHAETVNATTTRSAGRRLAATDGVDQPAHARGVDGAAHGAVTLRRGADDERVGEREQLGRRLGGHAAADEDRHVGHRAAPALDVLDRRGVAGGAPRDDEAV